MTRTVIGLSLVMAFGLASLGAQTGTSTPASSASDRENITVTGCLQKDASGGYVLTNAHIDKTTMPGASSTTSSSSATSGTTGTAGTSASSSSSMGVTFKLEGSAAELDKHVGHKIQVTGKEGPSTPPSSSASTAPPSSSATGATATGTTGSVTKEEQKTKSETTENARKLDVRSVKMISSSCP